MLERLGEERDTPDPVGQYSIAVDETEIKGIKFYIVPVEQRISYEMRQRLVYFMAIIYDRKMLLSVVYFVSFECDMAGSFRLTDKPRLICDSRLDFLTEFAPVFYS